MKLRRQVVEYMREHPQLYEGECSMTLDAYLEAMRLDDAWGGRPELRAITELFKREVIVYFNSGEEWHCGPATTKASPQPILLAGGIDNQHFDALVPMQYVQASSFVQELVYSILEDALATHFDPAVRRGSRSEDKLSDSDKVKEVAFGVFSSFFAVVSKQPPTHAHTHTHTHTFFRSMMRSGYASWARSSFSTRRKATDSYCRPTVDPISLSITQQLSRQSRVSSSHSSRTNLSSLTLSRDQR